ncbi:hypothetical protein KY346_06035 [Candidatus Woesearchaeota archaeon]|nr:hypothetical protein [Candidatus Woesearchaeota archaeon]
MTLDDDVSKREPRIEPGRKPVRDWCLKAWEEGGTFRRSLENTARYIGDLFEQGMTIGEIRVEMGYEKNHPVARFLRQAGWDIPYAQRQTRPVSGLKYFYVSPQEFYENISKDDVKKKI